MARRSDDDTPPQLSDFPRVAETLERRPNAPLWEEVGEAHLACIHGYL